MTVQNDRLITNDEYHHFIRMIEATCGRDHFNNCKTVSEVSELLRPILADWNCIVDEDHRCVFNSDADKIQFILAWSA